jgi:hypothetical protein
MVRNRSLLAAFACFVARSSITLPGLFVEAKLTEGVNGRWIETTVLE